jgi:hypothetical protein
MNNLQNLDLAQFVFEFRNKLKEYNSTAKVSFLLSIDETKSRPAIISASITTTKTRNHAPKVLTFQVGIGLNILIEGLDSRLESIGVERL